MITLSCLIIVNALSEKAKLDESVASYRTTLRHTIAQDEELFKIFNESLPITLPQ